MFDSSVFKSYDIRGIYGKEMDDDFFYRIGRFFISYYNIKNIVIAQDSRISSPKIFSALTKGITDQGANVLNLGLVPVECLYFAVNHYKYQAGIMITASHNPKEYNGLKLVKRNGESSEILSGKIIYELFLENSVFSEPKERGKIKDINLFDDYIKYIFSIYNSEEIKPFKVVLDAGNGTAGNLISNLKDKLPIKIIPLNFEPDGNFPNRPPNPLLAGAGKMASSLILKEKADMGFLFDGDGDRVFLADENGKMARADVFLLILAKYFLKKHPGGSIAYNLICSKSVPEFIKKWGGKPLRTQVGFINVSKAIVQNKGLMGGELSGHYCFSDFFNFDSGIIAFLVCLIEISKSGKKVSEIIKELSPYAKGDETNFEVKNKEEIIEKIKEKYSDGKQDFLDGVTIDYENWWLNARASQTESLLRLTIEADNLEILEKKKKELTDFIESNK